MSKYYILPALVAVALAAPAVAQAPTEAVITVLETSDLDLTDPAHQRLLERRVQSAIDDVCEYPRMDLRAARHASACRKLARAGAEAQIGQTIAQARLAKARLAAVARSPAA